MNMPGYRVYSTGERAGTKIPLENDDDSSSDEAKMRRTTGSSTESSVDDEGNPTAASNAGKQAQSTDHMNQY